MCRNQLATFFEDMTHKPSAVVSRRLFIVALLLINHVADLCNGEVATDGKPFDKRSSLAHHHPQLHRGDPPHGLAADDGEADGSLVRSKRSTDDEDTVADDGNDDGWSSETNQRGPEEEKKWSKNTVRVWGKRASDDVSNEFGDDAIDEFVNNDDKRTWSRNKVRVWGKRNGKEEIGEASDEQWRQQNNIDEEKNSEPVGTKRRWSNNKVRVWGKRNDNTNRYRYEFPPSLLADLYEKSVSRPRHQMAASLFAQRNKNSTFNGIHRSVGDGTKMSDNDGDDYDDDTVDFIRKRAAVVKRAIDLSAAATLGDKLAWSPSGGARTIRRPYPSISSSQNANRWTTGAKRANYAGYRGASGVRYPFYSAEGPKRSWRTNVIRVWG